MDAFDDYIPTLLKEEGGYTNDPDDAGGETNWGITIARARAAGYTGDMKDMTRDQAIGIYRLFYWIQPAFDLVVPVSYMLADLCLDLGVNLGTSWPGQFMQRALNVLMPGKPLTVDNSIGAMTRYTLSQFLDARGPTGETVLDDMIRAQASVRYIAIAERIPADQKYEYGWQRARAFAIEQLSGSIKT